LKYKHNFSQVLPKHLTPFFVCDLLYDKVSKDFANYFHSFHLNIINCFQFFFYPKSLSFFLLLRCINCCAYFTKNSCWLHFRLRVCGLSFVTRHHYQQLRCGCELIASLSLTSSSHRRLIVGFQNYSSSYRWLKQLLVIVIVSSSVAFFDFETIWSTKSFQKVWAFQKLFSEREYTGEPTRKETWRENWTKIV